MTFDQRLADFPARNLALSQPVRLRWNAHAVPYVEAQTDTDAAYVLGLVHAHLRLAQMHILKRIAQGRVAEMLGPFAVELDHALRLLDLTGAAAACEGVLDARTRQWLEPFVRGLNAAQAQITRRPPEFRWLALQAEPWTLRDVLTLGRLIGADVNWSGYLDLLRTRHDVDFAQLWQRVRRVGGGAAAGALGRALTQLSRAGSNSVAVGASRSASGAPLLANDPHLGQALPNFWVLAGLRCPGYEMVGLMPAGLPFVGVGASPHAAWGGTNMRAASSDLVDVSSLPADQIDTQLTRIRVRGWGTRTRIVRRTPHGPILNDAKLLGVRGAPVALRWMGHAPSDEIGAFLRAARARTPLEFREAFSSFGVCAQNIQFATRDGHIGHLYAARLPRRSGWPQDTPVLSPAQAEAAWQHTWDACSLPLTLDPPCGYRVSANDRPQFVEMPLGFFFSEGDRAARLAQLVEREALTLDDLRALQRDTQVPGAPRLALALLERLDAAGLDTRPLAALRQWSGHYDADAPEPVAFEALLHGLALGLRPARATVARRHLDDEWGRHTRLLLDDLDALSPLSRRRVLARGLRSARAAQQRYASWGAMHRLRISHLLGSVPPFGRALRVVDWPAGGSRESPMKNAHGLVRRRHAVQYGAQARHVSDLADLDANHFVLLGGNDGWIGSAQYADQLALWAAHRDLRLPLRAATVAEEFPRVMDLRPACAPSPQARDVGLTSGVPAG